MSKVILNYLGSLVLVTCVFALAWIALHIGVKKIPRLCNGKPRTALFLVGSAFILVAAIGRLGSTQTYDRDSFAERLDQWIFLGLCLIGTFVRVFEYLARRLGESGTVAQSSSWREIQSGNTRTAPGGGQQGIGQSL